MPPKVTQLFVPFTLFHNLLSYKCCVVLNYLIRGESSTLLKRYSSVIVLYTKRRYLYKYTLLFLLLWCNLWKFLQLPGIMDFEPEEYEYEGMVMDKIGSPAWAMDMIKETEFDDSDIFVVSYPKCGKGFFYCCFTDIFSDFKNFRTAADG